MSFLEISPVFPRELRKGVVAGKKKKALAASKANMTSVAALERQSGVGIESLTFRDSPQIPKKKAD
jgi:hypothetical protein